MADSYVWERHVGGSLELNIAALLQPAIEESYGWGKSVALTIHLNDLFTSLTLPNHKSWQSYDYRNRVQQNDESGKPLSKVKVRKLGIYRERRVVGSFKEFLDFYGNFPLFS